MTRINLVPPAELHTKHLVAEYRELPRIFALAHEARMRGELPTDRRNPTTYVLGTGHVRFFYPRLLFLALRHRALIQEMLDRGFKPSFVETYGLDRVPPDWRLDYVPTPEALTLNRARILERRPKP